MAKKTLLSEGNIRKFMKLAAIEPLTENFLAEADLDEEKMDEADCGSMEEEMMAEADEPADDMPADEPMGDDDMPADEPMGDDDMPEMGADAEGEGAIKDALRKLIDAIKGAPEAEITIDEAAEDMEEGMYEELNESVQVVDTGAMVKEVSRRVAQRLLKESKQEQLAEALAAKIAAKLG